MYHKVFIEVTFYKIWIIVCKNLVDMVNRLFKAAKQNPAFKTAVAARRADIEEEVRKYQQQDNEQSSKKKQSKKLLGW